jgi:BMFP domain-containing protein YqiC|tara:strand:+ start:348 stop:599 length:252 start_codon:yes stop_codon:yes gene_type:complete
MKKTKFVIDRLAKLVEQGIVNYKDISEDILSILKSKRDEIVFKMKLTSKEETDILSKRIEKLEKKIENLEKRKKTKSKSAKKS